MKSITFIYICEEDEKVKGNGWDVNRVLSTSPSTHPAKSTYNSITSKMSQLFRSPSWGQCIITYCGDLKCIDTQQTFESTFGSKPVILSGRPTSNQQAENCDRNELISRMGWYTHYIMVGICILLM